VAKFSYSFTTFTPTATADAGALANGSYMAVQGGNATQRLTFIEVYLGGQAGASSPTFMLLSRDSTVGVTMSSTSGAMQAALDGTHSVLSVVPIGYTIAGAWRGVAERIHRRYRGPHRGSYHLRTSVVRFPRLFVIYSSAQESNHGGPEPMRHLCH
jgi:hypothetical protein